MRKWVLLAVSLLLLAYVTFLPATAVVGRAHADEAQTTRQVPDFGVDRPQADASEGTRLGHTVTEISLSIAVLVFGTILMALEILVMLKQAKYWEAWSFKILGLTLVITAGLFLIVAGYSQNQVAPMMGLLGTVAGYLLGKDADNAQHEQRRSGAATTAGSVPETPDA